MVAESAVSTSSTSGIQSLFSIFVMAVAPSAYPLHECIFRNDVRQLSTFLHSQSHDASQKDMHGNTPLHLAVMLGRKECVQILLAHGAQVKVKNLEGWSPLAEAISYGDRPTISCLLRKLKLQSRETMERRRPNITSTLNQMGDFYMELKWDFQSWIPLVSRMLPSDVCRLHKKGFSVRVDTTLVDFNDMKWERGDISFIFNGDAKMSDSLFVLDNKLKVYQRVRYEDTEAEIEDELDILMSSDIVATHMSTKSITFTRAQSGWLFREDRTEKVGNFRADFYAVNGMVMASRKRREHLSEEDLQRNKAFMENFAKGGNMGLDTPIDRRPSLAPPPCPAISWEAYSSAPYGRPPQIGRPLMVKDSARAFKATVAMSEDFPLSIQSLLNLLEVTTPFQHLNKLRKFVQMKLPPGFPVKIDIPILPTVTAKITFQEFKLKDDVDDSYFEIPDDYMEDPIRFPDL